MTDKGRNHYFRDLQARFSETGFFSSLDLHFARFMTRLATANLGEGRIAFAPAAGTRMAGPPDAMAFEQTFLARLSAVSTFAVDGDVLHLSAGDSEALTFKRTE